MASRFPFTASDKGVYVLDGIANFRVYCRLGLEGPLQIPLLGRAIEYAVTKTPILKGVVRLGRFRSCWEVVEELSPSSIFRAEDFSSRPNAAEQAEALVDHYINLPLDITCQPPVHFLLIRTAPEQWTFICRVHHCALDGVGIFHLIQDIQDAYQALWRGEALPPVGAMGDRGRWPLLRCVPLRLWGQVVWHSLRRALQYERVHQRKIFVRFSSPRPSSDAISYQSLRLAGQAYERLRQQSKRLGVTFNDLVITALCRAIHRWNQEPPSASGLYTFTMTVDLRRYLRRHSPLPRIMSNYAGGTLVIIPATAVTTLADTAAYVAATTRFLKEHHLALGQNLMLPLLHLIPPRWLRERVQRSYRRNPSKFVPTVAVSNLGRVDTWLSRFSQCQIQSIDIISTAYEPGGLFLVVSSYQNVCHLTLTYRQSVCSEPEVSALLRLLAQELLGHPEANACADPIAAALTGVDSSGCSSDNGGDSGVVPSLMRGDG